MPDTDKAHEAVEQLDHLDLPEVDHPGFDRRSFLRRTALTGIAAGSVGSILSACGSSASSSGSGGSASVFGSHPGYKFVFVNHVTTNPFFTPTQYGAADACSLLGCSYQWTGSENSNVSQMVDAL
jgi:simple sugar transport system substrate-binding protein